MTATLVLTAPKRVRKAVEGKSSGMAVVGTGEEPVIIDAELKVSDKAHHQTTEQYKQRISLPGLQGMTASQATSRVHDDETEDKGAMPPPMYPGDEGMSQTKSVASMYKWDQYEENRRFLTMGIYEALYKEAWNRAAKNDYLKLSAICDFKFRDLNLTLDEIKKQLYFVTDDPHVEGSSSLSPTKGKPLPINVPTPREYKSVVHYVEAMRVEHSGKSSGMYGAHAKAVMDSCERVHSQIDMFKETDDAYTLRNVTGACDYKSLTTGFYSFPSDINKFYMALWVALWAKLLVDPAARDTLFNKTGKAYIIYLPDEESDDLMRQIYGTEVSSYNNAFVKIAGDKNTPYMCKHYLSKHKNFDNILKPEAVDAAFYVNKQAYVSGSKKFRTFQTITGANVVGVMYMLLRSMKRVFYEIKNPNPITYYAFYAQPILESIYNEATPRYSQTEYVFDKEVEEQSRSCFNYNLPLDRTDVGKHATAEDVTKMYTDAEALTNVPAAQGYIEKEWTAKGNMITRTIWAFLAKLRIVSRPDDEDFYNRDTADKEDFDQST